MAPSISALLRPRSIAILGASADFNKLNGRTLKALLDKHYAGALHPVNPKYPEIVGLPCYPDVAAIPGGFRHAVGRARHGLPYRVAGGGRRRVRRGHPAARDRSRRSDGHLLDIVEAATSCTMPAGNCIGFITRSGGAGALMADRAEELGLNVATLATETTAALKNVVPVFGSTGNPVDITAQGLVDPSLMRESLKIVLADRY